MWFKKKHGRGNGFARVKQLVDERNMKNVVVVETGTLRNDEPTYMNGDGWSTIFFRKLINQLGGELYSVDIDPDAIAVSKRVIEREFGNLRNTHHHTEDSAAFLRGFAKTIDILYLDSFNYKEGDDSSARHQLAEIQACIDKVSPSGIILVDDICESLEYGKPALSIPFLKEQGWNKIELVPVVERTAKQWYQAILLK